jgi:hypothetical protein
MSFSCLKTTNWCSMPARADETEDEYEAMNCGGGGCSEAIPVLSLLGLERAGVSSFAF